MAIFTSKSEAAGRLDTATPAELIAHAEELLAAAEGGIKLQSAKDIPILKAALASAYAQVALARLTARSQQEPGAS
jgi:hypothetical protein